MKVICINNSNKPNNIPDSEWIKKDEIYTVTSVKAMGLQPGKFGYLLKEIQLSELSFPYELYDADRFIPLNNPFLKQQKQTVSETVVEEEELLTI